MAWRLRGWAFLVTALLIAAMGAGACNGGQNSPPPGVPGDVGTLRMALTASASGHTYRLRQATFTIAGPTPAVLDSEAQPDATALTAVLNVGSYTITLSGPWFLERTDGTEPQRVNATLASSNPAAFQITAGATTGVPFQFTTDGMVIVTIGTGGVSVTTEVTEVTGQLSLLAGKLGGLGSGDGIGPDGRFFDPMGIVGDGAGNLYVADTFNNTIRRIAIATLEVTTIAGTPTLSGADDGVGPLARFNWPTGPALDGAGNLYVADRFNSTIRKIVLATGQVTTFAGTAGTAGSADGIGPNAQFNDPRAVAGDGVGNLYVADGNFIRKIVIVSRSVSTLAGGGTDPFGGQDGTGTAATFAGPQGLTADGAGNLYVADTGSMTIRKVVIATGEVTTIAGAPHESGTTDGVGTEARLSEPTAVALDGAGNLFIADGNNNRIRQMVLATGQVTTLAGDMFGAADGIGPAAQFDVPQGIASDGDGNLWVTDTFNDAIRKVVIATGAVTTPVGALFPFDPQADGVGGAISLSGVASMVSDGAGNIYLGEGTTIRKLVVATGEVTTVAGDPNESSVVDGVGGAVRFSGPHGLAFDAGVLYMADDNTIRQLVLATGEATTIAGSPGLGGSADGIGTAASFDAPGSVASDGAGNLYVADFFNALIRRIELGTGAVTTIAGVAGAFTILDGVGTAAMFGNPQALVHDGAGTLYLMDGTALRRIVLATAEVTTIAGAPFAGSENGIGTAAHFSLSDGLARDGAGNLFIADTQGHMIRKFAIATGAVSTLIGNPTAFGVHLGKLPARLTLPGSVVVLPNGSLAISDEAAVLLATF